MVYNMGLGLSKKTWLAIFQPGFIEDLRFWVEKDRKLSLRAFDMIDTIMRDPFDGIGKPEPLKYLAPGVCSRRLTQEHRIIYLVFDDQIDFLQGRYNY
jgi:toxin YoeB